jgi:hypothetical protein
MEVSLEQQPLLGNDGMRNRFNSKLNTSSDSKKGKNYQDEKPSSIFTTPITPPYKGDSLPQRK